MSILARIGYILTYLVFVKKFCIILIWLLFSAQLRGQVKDSTDQKPLVQLCLIIDVSPSMKGLLVQAQTQIWGLLDYISTFQLNEMSPDVEISVITLGDYFDGYQQAQMRIVSDFTQDFKALADEMFLLQLGGGNEYFGQGVDRSIRELNWKEHSNFKSIIVAGNEQFNQGPVDFEIACKNALSHGVLVNTIFCGNYEQGQNLLWKEAAAFGGGSFTIMEQDLDSLNLETPFDDNIFELYQKFMSTYDLSTKQARYKAPPNGTVSPIYRNMILNRMTNFQAPKDIIHDFEESGWDFDAIKAKELPESLQDLTKQELQEYLVKTTQRRNNARDGLILYQRKIEDFLNVKLGAKKDGKTLELAVKEIIGDQLRAKGFVKLDD